jgi:hypothetical protein
MDSNGPVQQRMKQEQFVAAARCTVRGIQQTGRATVAEHNKRGHQGKMGPGTVEMENVRTCYYSLMTSPYILE